MTPTTLLRTCAAAAFTVASALSAHAATIDQNFTSFWVLGDSLSDNGNVFAATGQPGAPYVNGRFSNGPVWSDHIGNLFQSSGKAYGNVAFGGAKALLDGDLLPDLPIQLGFFGTSSSGILGARPLVSLWFGGNDLLAAVGGGASGQAAADAANAIADTADIMALGGVNDFLIMTLPDLGSAPRYALFQPTLAAEASIATGIFNDTLKSRIGGLRAKGLNVTVVDAAALSAGMLANPASVGVSNVTVPCVFPDAATASAFGQAPVCSATEAQERAFFDGVHPNATVHQAIADAVVAAYAPTVVPVPAGAPLLLLGVSALALLRRRT